MARKYLSLLCISKLKFIYTQFCGGNRNKAAITLYLINDIYTHSGDIMKVMKNKSLNDRSSNSLST